MVLANLLPLKLPGVNSLGFSLTNGLNTCDTARLIRLGVLLKEKALLTRLLNLPEEEHSSTLNFLRQFNINFVNFLINC